MEESTPQAAFLVREQAERVAAERNAQAFRESQPVDYLYGWPGRYTDLKKKELSARISAILGRPFVVTCERRGQFPDDMTAEQAREIAGLFRPFFYSVVEADLVA